MGIACGDGGSSPRLPPPRWTAEPARTGWFVPIVGVMQRHRLVPLASALLALALATGCTTPPPSPAPARTPGVLGIVPPQPRVPVELWRGEEGTQASAVEGHPTCW